MPALSHLLSVGKGRVLSLAADDKYVYAGCQSAENEIVVRARGLAVERCLSLGVLAQLVAAHVPPAWTPRFSAGVDGRRGEAVARQLEQCGRHTGELCRE